MDPTSSVPRPPLGFVPGKVSGEPHLDHSRIMTLTVTSLYDRFGDVDKVAALYPDVSQEAIWEAIDLERQLAA